MLNSLNQEGIFLYKMHGLGNDFVIIDSQKNTHVHEKIIFKEDNFYILKDKNFILNMAHRNLGVGFDQMAIFNLDKEKQILYIKIYNQDSSSVSMCVNIVRCLASLVFELYGIKSLEMYVGPKKITSQINSEGLAEINLYKYSKIEEIKETDVALELNKYGVHIKYFDCLSVGNPHLVLIEEKDAPFDKNKLAQYLSENKVFKKLDGVNINFINSINIIERDVIDLAVYERGVGFTLACGSGAAVSFAFANKLGFVSNKAIVKFKYGNLNVRYDEDKNIIISGECKLVMSAIYYY